MHIIRRTSPVLGNEPIIYGRSKPRSVRSRPTRLPPNYDVRSSVLIPKRNVCCARGEVSAGQRIADAFLDYRASGGVDDGIRFESDEDALQQFVTLCQTASFLARGRDA